MCKNQKNLCPELYLLSCTYSTKFCKLLNDIMNWKFGTIVSSG